MNAKNTRLSDHGLLSALEDYAKVVNCRCFPAIEFDNWANRRCQSRTISERFGSWQKALSIIGIEGGKRYGRKANLEFGAVLEGNRAPARKPEDRQDWAENIRETLQANLGEPPQGL